MTLTTCCCRCSLQTGTKIIASLAIICILINIGCSLYDLIINSGLRGIENLSAIQNFAWSIAYLVSAVLLLTASFRKIKPFYIIPWLSLTAMGIIIGPILCIYLIVIVVTLYGYPLALAIPLGVGIPCWGIVIYFCLVVYSFYKQIEPTAVSPLITNSNL